MNFTQDQIAAIVGTKELELIGLRMEVAYLKAELEKLKPKPENVVPIKEDANGTG